MGRAYTNYFSKNGRQTPTYILTNFKISVENVSTAIHQRTFCPTSGR